MRRARGPGESKQGSPPRRAVPLLVAAMGTVVVAVQANGCTFDFDAPFSSASPGVPDGSAGSGGTSQVDSSAGGAGGSAGDSGAGGGLGGDGSVESGGDGGTGGTAGAGGGGSGGTGGVGGAGGSAGSGGTGGLGGSGATGGSAGSGGTGGCDVSTSWTYYEYQFDSAAWSNTSLCNVWTEPYAPPTSGIAAAEMIYDFDRLIVVTDAGMVHVRDATTWRPPVTATSFFPGLANVDAMYHIPYAWSAYWDPAAPHDASITIMQRPLYRAYAYHDDDTTSFLSTGPLTDESPPGPMSASATCYWSFGIMDLAQAGTPDGFVFYFEYEDGYLYRANAALEWSRWPVEQSPLWEGKPGAPPAGTLRAAWYDQYTRIARFVGE